MALSGLPTLFLPRHCRGFCSQGRAEGSDCIVVVTSQPYGNPNSSSEGSFRVQAMHISL